jgi:hypothetical protein
VTPTESSSSSRWNPNLTVAIIAALAAIAGAAVGGFATYFGNHELQESAAHAAAKGAARVLQGDLASIATRIDIELSQHRYLAIGAQSAITISAEDEKEIAANVSARTWDHIASAKLVVQDEQESSNELGNIEVLEARKHLPVTLKGARLHFEENSFQALREAVSALKELTGADSGD